MTFFELSLSHVGYSGCFDFHQLFKTFQLFIHHHLNFLLNCTWCILWYHTDSWITHWIFWINFFFLIWNHRGWNLLVWYLSLLLFLSWILWASELMKHFLYNQLMISPTILILLWLSYFLRYLIFNFLFKKIFR